MYLINIILAIWGPHLAGSFAGYLRKIKTAKLLRAVGLGDREEMAESYLKILKRKKADQHTVGWSMIALFTLVQLILPAPVFGKAVGIFLTLGIGMNRMFRDLSFLILKADEAALRGEVKLVSLAGEKVRAEALMASAVRFGEPVIQLFGVEWLVKWKSPWAVDFLQEVGENTLNFEIRSLCESGYQGGMDLFRKEDVTHIVSLRELVDQSRFWRRVAMSFQGEDPLLWEGAELDEIEERIVDAFRLQGELTRCHPFNYCKEGLSRGELSQIHGWKYVVGRLSQDYRKMVPDVLKVIGRIGSLENNTDGKGELVIGLWDPKEQAATAAELDELEIEAGRELNYDWAISAVIEALRNRMPDGELKLEVKIDPQIPLSPNTRNLLNEITK